MVESFRCFLVTKTAGGAIQAGIEQRTTDELPLGDVLIEAAFSSLNYKDALSATGHPGVTRKFPHVPGIDAAGTVKASTSPRFQPGDEVLVTGFDLGMNTWGGYSQLVRVPADWVLPLPKALNAYESMALGTAGFTAALCLDALAKRGIDPAAGRVLVTGASGGVGSIAVALLAKAGYQVVAVSGKASAAGALRRLGARQVIPREDVQDASDKPLLKPGWIAAVDTVGGVMLGTVLRSIAYGGCVAACGLVGGGEVPMTVYPFILRGIELVGIDSVLYPLEKRAAIWEKLAGPWRPPGLAEITSTIGLEELPARIQSILAGENLGRTVVRPV